MQEYQIILRIKTRKKGIKGKVFTAASLYLLPKGRKEGKKGEKEKENGEKSFCCPIVKKKKV